jgi:hypothetical protein
MAKVYRTAQGRSLDIEKIRLKNETAQAIGNMNVNARGDQLGSGGKIVKKREELVAEHYNSSHKTPQRKNKSSMDIPTSGGKAKRVENFEPAGVEIDNQTIPDNNEVVENSTTDEIKGGLAKAIAKTKEYNEKAGNKGPKRL